MKTSVCIAVLLCLQLAQGFQYSRRALRQTSASLDISIDGEGRASGRSSAGSYSSTSTDSEVVGRAATLFRTANDNLSSGPAGQALEEYCPYALSVVNAEAEAVVTAQASAFARTASSAEAEGDAYVTTSASASASARAETFAVALVEGVAQANIGANRAYAEGLVRNEIGVFAEAFATADTSATVDGSGSASATTTSRASAAITAVARVAIRLTAQVDCTGSFVEGDAVSTSEVLSSEASSGSGASSSASGTAADSSAVGDAGGSSDISSGR